MLLADLRTSAYLFTSTLCGSKPAATRSAADHRHQRRPSQHGHHRGEAVALPRVQRADEGSGGAPLRADGASASVRSAVPLSIRLQEMMASIGRRGWNWRTNRAEAFRRAHSLPKTFSRMVFTRRRTGDRCGDRGAVRLARALGRTVCAHRPVLRGAEEIRDRIVHGEVGGSGSARLRNRTGLLCQSENAALQLL